MCTNVLQATHAFAHMWIHKETQNHYVVFTLIPVYVLSCRSWIVFSLGTHGHTLSHKSHIRGGTAREVLLGRHCYTRTGRGRRGEGLGDGIVGGLAGGRDGGRSVLNRRVGLGSLTVI